MQTVLVTGATGFIASHLLPVLDRQGWSINAAIHQNTPSILLKTIAVGDIDGKTVWRESLSGIDIVIHLAARAHILQESTSDSEFFRVNTEGTANLVKQSIEAGVKHFIFISSIGAMATLSDRILSENSPCHPDTPYGRSKLKAEQALIDLAKNSEMTWTILRPTLVYGAGNPGNMERLIQLVNLGLPLPFGAINNRRSFIFVGNLVDAIATCLTHPQAVNQIFIVSDGQDLSTPELISQIARQMDKTCHFLSVPISLLKLIGSCGDVVQSLTKQQLFLNTGTIERLTRSLFVDISHIQNTLNWSPPYTVEQGLKQTIN